MQFLIVEDDPKFCEAMRAILVDYGTVRTAYSVNDALSFFGEAEIDVLIADYFLPDGNGLHLIDSYRKKNRQLKTLLISGGTTKEIAIECVKHKVDSILEKPFGGLELLESLRLILPEVFCWLDSKESTLHIKDCVFSLTSTEFKIIQILIDNSSRRIGRKEIYQNIWGDDEISDNVFDTHLGNLKKKLGSYSSIINNKKGIGYTFDFSIIK